MENFYSIDLFNRAVAEHKKWALQNFKKIKSIYPDAKIIAEEDAFLHLIHNSENLDDAFEQMTENYPNSQTNIKNLTASIEWNRFKHNNNNTDFLERETFELFFDNEYYFLLQGGKSKGVKGIEAVHKIFLRLHEIYNKRFIESEPHEKENEKGLTKIMIFKLLNEFDFLNTKSFNNLSRGGQKKLIAKILGCHERTAQAYLNGDEKYDTDINSQSDLNKLVKIIKET